MIGSKGPSDALAQLLETLIDQPNTNSVVIFHRKMARAVSVPAAHCTRSVRAADQQLWAKYLLTPASYYDYNVSRETIQNRKNQIIDHTP